MSGDVEVMVKLLFDVVDGQRLDGRRRGGSVQQQLLRDSVDHVGHNRRLTADLEGRRAGQPAERQLSRQTGHHAVTRRRRTAVEVDVGEVGQQLVQTGRPAAAVLRTPRP